MKSVLPNIIELMILASVAVLCALFASRLSPDDSSLALFTFPLLLVALFMGARRTWKSQAARAVVRARQTEKVAVE